MKAANLFSSSVGKKFIMAATGLALFMFVALHMVGNLQIFLGPEVINRYGDFLQTNVELIWPARIGLLVIVGLHIMTAIQLSAENKAARPVAYQQQTLVAASYASRTMLMSGLIILAFIIFHLLHFTLQVQAFYKTGIDIAQLKDGQGRHDVYAMIVFGFQSLWVSGFYIFAMYLLFLHLSHGLSAMFQSLGLKSPGYGPWIQLFARVVPWLIFLGYISIPIAVTMGYGDAYLEKMGVVKK